jgi:hypothetical protein
MDSTTKANNQPAPKPVAPERRGLLTFNAEGNNSPNSIFYSRVLHWPGNSAECPSWASGVTIGRGYDIGSRKEADVMSTLIRAGLSKNDALAISKGAGLKRCDAMSFVKENKDKIPEITLQQQNNLFDIIYADYVAQGKSFYTRHKKSKDSVTWDELDFRLQDVLIDMLYQGQMDKEFVPTFEKNDPDKVVELIQSKKHLMFYEPARNRIKHLRGTS